MRSRESWGSPLVILQLVVGVFLVALGLAELIEYNSELNQFARSVSRAFGGSGSVLPVLVALIEIVAGALLVAGLFTPVPAAAVFWTSIIIAVLWIVQALVGYVFNDPFEPSVFVWLSEFTRELILGLAIWTVGRRYA
ncbi:MAG: DoxX family membrane protein [Spirochaetaceae bacterium]